MDASAETELGEQSDYFSSSVWWRWKAVESGWCELRGNALVSIRTQGISPGWISLNNYYLNGESFVRFRAVAGLEYFLLAATEDWKEGLLRLSLKRIAGLEHSVAETAFDMGSAPAFSSPERVVPAGPFIMDSGDEGTGSLSCRWTAPATGWVTLDTEGAASGASLRVWSEAEPVTAMPYSAKEGFPETFVNHRSLLNSSPGSTLPAVVRQPLPERLVQDMRGMPGISRLLMPVTAGGSYLIQAIPPADVGGGSAPVKVNLRPASGPPPKPGTVRIRELRPSTARDCHMLEAVIPVSSPNGLMRGSSTIMGKTLYFTDADRIAGDARDGEYRVVVPVPPGFSSTKPVGMILKLFDRCGGAWPSSPHAAGQRLIIDPRPATLVESTADKLPPVLDGAMIAGPGAVPLTARGTEDIRLHGEPVTIRLRLGIRDFGGSGFAGGEIFIGSDDSPSSSRRFASVPFSSAQRTAGDALLGIYEVPFTIPAYATLGRIRCRLYDSAGNFAGQSVVADTTATPWEFIQVDGGWLGGNLPFSQNSDLRSGTTATYFSDDSIALPFIVQQEEPVDEVPPVISETEAVLDERGNIRVTARLRDERAGIAGGDLTLVDPYGLVIARPGFAEEQRMDGTVLDGHYEITVPVPGYGAGGGHRLHLRVTDRVGRVTMERDIGPVPLPDRMAEDQRRPRLTRFEISPPEVDLTTGPAELRVILTAEDDRPGITAMCRISDSAGVLLSEQRIDGGKPALDYAGAITLPARSLIGRESAARVELVLTDSAGRTEIYGQSGSPAWPDGAAVSLTLRPASDPFTLWAASWPGLPMLPPDSTRDSDQDGMADLLEFALGTDPTVAPAGDFFRSSMPSLRVSRVFLQAPAQVPSVNLLYWFNTAPAFEKTGGLHANGPWRLQLEESVDLREWLQVPLADPIAPGLRMNRTEAVRSGRSLRLRVWR